MNVGVLLIQTERLVRVAGKKIKKDVNGIMLFSKLKDTAFFRLNGVNTA